MTLGSIQVLYRRKSGKLSQVAWLEGGGLIGSPIRDLLPLSGASILSDRVRYSVF